MAIDEQRREARRPETRINTGPTGGDGNRRKTAVVVPDTKEHEERKPRKIKGFRAFPETAPGIFGQISDKFPKNTETAAPEIKDDGLRGTLIQTKHEVGE